MRSRSLSYAPALAQPMRTLKARLCSGDRRRLILLSATTTVALLRAIARRGITHLARLPAREFSSFSLKGACGVRILALSLPKDSLDSKLIIQGCVARTKWHVQRTLQHFCQSLATWCHTPVSCLLASFCTNEAVGGFADKVGRPCSPSKKSVCFCRPETRRHLRADFFSPLRQISATLYVSNK